jgi:hypothetical protein
MDSSFRTDLVKDATISDITDDLTFAVESGAANCTYQQFPATSPSNSSLVFSVQLPSESIVMGRDLLIRSALTFRILCGSATAAANQVPVGQPAFKYGVDSSLAAFPFSSLITTASVQINNTNVSINLQDVFPQLLCMNSREHLAYYNGMTPSLPDGDYATYSDAVGATNNPVAAYSNGGYDNRLEGRGSFPVSISVLHNITAGGTDASLISTAVTDTWVITLSAMLTEPLFLSPFIWGDPVKNAQGLVGINNMAFTLNIDGGLKRVFSSGSPFITGLQAGTSVNSSLFASSGAQLATSTPTDIPTLLIKFLSTQGSDIIKAKNVVPYTDFPRYITTNTASVSPFLTGAGAPVPVPLTTQNLQLNQMPSKIMVCVRKPMSGQSFADTSTFLTITSVSINLNNASGLLSSASQADLWRMSSRNGSNQTWTQFSGLANKVGTYAAAANGISLTGTGGSLLVLNPAFDLSLPDYLSNGSLGNYNLQMSITVVNQYGGVPFVPEIVIVCVNDGILTSQSGVSSTFTGILSKEMVLNAKSLPATSSAVECRMIGGALLNGHRFRSSRFAGAVSGGASSGGAMHPRSRLSHLLR